MLKNKSHFMIKDLINKMTNFTLSEIENQNHNQQLHHHYNHQIEFPDYLTEIIEFMADNSIFNTYLNVNHTTSDNEFSIMIQTKSIKLSELLKHLTKYTRIKSDDPLIQNDEECVICFEKYQKGQYKRVLDCQHTFHKKCIDQWFRKNVHRMNCPLCRTNHNRKIVIDI